jgi:uncharacterized protein
MTTLGLAFLITLAILFQLALFAGIAFFRHWGAYQALRQRVEAPASAEPAAAGEPLVPDPAPAWEGFRPFRVARRVVEDALGSVCSFYLTPLDGLPLPAYRPGQFLTFRLEVPDPVGATRKSIVRCYSLSDRPQPDQYRISIKRVPAPPGHPELPPGLSSGHFHDRVQEGDVLQVRAPSGHFHLRDDAADPRLPVVLVAGGIGITPLLAMANTLLAAGDPRPLWLFYGVRHGGEAIQLDTLRGLAARHPNFHLQLCFSAPRPEDREGVDFQHLGHADIQRLRLSLPLRRHRFYVCGPKPMMEALIPALEAWGVAEGDLHYEAFGPASVLRAPHPAPPSPAPQPRPAAPPFAITFRKSGRTLPWDGADSLLAFAEAHGIPVDSGCRAGGCGCCQTALPVGEVAYRRPPDAEVAPGHCLLCISTPNSDLTLEA